MILGAGVVASRQRWLGAAVTSVHCWAATHATGDEGRFAGWSHVQCDVQYDDYETKAFPWCACVPDRQMALRLGRGCDPHPSAFQCLTPCVWPPGPALRLPRWRRRTVGPPPCCDWVPAQAPPVAGARRRIGPLSSPTDSSSRLLYVVCSCTCNIHLVFCSLSDLDSVLLQSGTGPQTTESLPPSLPFFFPSFGRSRPHHVQ